MDSLKIVLLADTHFGYNSGAVHAQEIVDKINEQNPDLVCIAGDILIMNMTLSANLKKYQKSCVP